MTPAFAPITISIEIQVDADHLDAQLDAIRDGLASLRTRLQLAAGGHVASTRHAEPLNHEAEKVTISPPPVAMSPPHDTPPHRVGRRHPITHAEIDAHGEKLGWLTPLEIGVLRGRADNLPYVVIAERLGSTVASTQTAYTRAQIKLRRDTPPRRHESQQSPAPARTKLAARTGPRKPITQADLELAGETRLAWLTAKERRIVELVAAGLDDEAIATRVGSTTKAVGVQLTRARKKLARSLDDPPTPRRAKPRTVTLPIANEGSVWCQLCQANRTQLHVDNHHAQNEAERRRIEAGRASIAGLAPLVDGHGQKRATA